MQSDTDSAVTHPVAPAPKRAPEERRRPSLATRLAHRLRRHHDRPSARVAPAPETRPATALDAVDWHRWYPALIGFAAGVVAVTFALSYHGLLEFAHKIVGLPFGLAVLVPVGVDVFSLCCLAATFLTRDAPWRVRFYCWLMFACTVAVSIAGNAVYAAWFIRRPAVATALESWRYLPVAAVIGASLWPAFSAGALHLLIVVRRHMQRERDSARQAAAAIREQQDTEEQQQARALVLAAEGVSISDILEDLSLDVDRRRTVERWTKPVRDALTAPRPAVAAKPATRRVTARTEGATS